LTDFWKLNLLAGTKIRLSCNNELYSYIHKLIDMLEAEEGIATKQWRHWTGMERNRTSTCAGMLVLQLVGGGRGYDGGDDGGGDDGCSGSREYGDTS
jgi:hypothetical protein